MTVSAQPVSAKNRLRVSACMLFLALFQVATLAVGMKFALAGFADFRAFYGAGSIVRNGQSEDLYDYELQHRVQNATISRRTAALSFVYPVYAALPFVPLSLLSYRSAYLAWMGINAGLLGFAVWLMLPWLEGLQQIWKPLPWMLAASFYPVGIALLQGQVSILLLLLFCVCFVALERGRDSVAGALLALGLMKFHVVLPMMLLFLLWRRWRFVGGFAAGTAGLGAVCLAMSHWAGIRQYVGQIAEAARTGSVAGVRDDSMLPSARMPDLHGLGMALVGQARWGMVLVILASIAVLAWTAWRPVAFPRAVVAGLLVSWHLHLHDLSLLLLPLTLLLNSLALNLQGPALQDKERRFFFITLAFTLLWLASPVLAWMSGAGLNSLLALAMIPLLVFAAGQPGESGMLKL